MEGECTAVLQGGGGLQGREVRGKGLEERW